MERKLYKIGFLFVILIVAFVSVRAQDSVKSLGEFKYSGQSKTGILKSGELASFKLNAYGGFEYKIHIIAESKLGDVFFRVKKTSNEVIYDSQKEDVLEKLFIIEDSRMLLIEVVVPESENGTIEKGGVGVTIEYRKAD